MQVVIVTNASYRGETIEGTFDLVQDFTPFRGEVERRRNGRGGAGFIKVRPEGETLSRLAPNMAKPVKLTVSAEGVGYVVGGSATEGLTAGQDGCGAVALFELSTPEFGVDAERELAEQALPPAMAVALEVTLETLRRQFEEAKGRERDNLRKRLKRLEAKVTA